MAWDFETEPEFQSKLDWMDEFVRKEVEPLDYVLDSPWNVADPRFLKLVRPLQAEVRKQKLWACHLGPELGGEGYGQVKLSLMNEILGRSAFGPTVFGCQAPDSGNAEILAHFGTDDQKQRYLRPLLNNDIVSCYSMTEPHGGADPKVFKTTARLDGNEWVINGEKWFSSNARFAAFYIVLAVTGPEAEISKRMSMFVVPADTPGLERVRDVGYLGEKVASHGYIRYTNVRVPRSALLGEPGQGFLVAQTRLGGGRIHHAMRTLGQARKAFDMMCERALSRYTQGERLSEKQMVQEKIADSWAELEQFRLLVLRTAWRIDKYHNYNKVRKDIGAVKALMPKVLHDISSRALQVHGSIGISTEMPFASLVLESYIMGLVDGPTEVHKVTVAKQVLRDYAPTNDLFPAYNVLAATARAEEKYGPLLDE